MDQTKSPHIVILGGGFGGLEAAKALGKARCQVTLIDKSNHHLFQPLLYQVATAGLAGPAVAAPIRHILRKQSNACVLLAEVASVDPSGKLVVLADGSELSYDALIVACGATHSYFGNPQWAEFAPGLKTLDDAMQIRQRMLTAFEAAELEAAIRVQTKGSAALPPTESSPVMRFVVIGAGPTGVEMAGTMAEVARHTLRGEFRHIDPTRVDILLVEGGARVLPTFDEDLSSAAFAQLQRLGVNVMLDARVVGIDSSSVEIQTPGGRQRLESACTVWGAGVQASAIAKSLGVDLDRAGRVQVSADLAVEGLPKESCIFVVGDMASALSQGRVVPGVSPAAKQMGRCAAHNALALLNGGPLKAFRYRDYGALATIGRRSAIADVGGVKLKGTSAWLFWLFVHIFFLIGFKNRAVVMVEWAWSYFTFSRAARIFGRSR